jgi:membrane-associated phospholipid phosphatase
MNKTVKHRVNKMIFAVAGLVFFTCSGISYGINPDIPDKLPSPIKSKPDSAKVLTPRFVITGNLYKPDSVLLPMKNEGYFTSLFHNLGAQATAPLHFTAKQWAITGASIGITTALFSLDGKIDSWARVQKHEHPWIKATSPVITEFGNRYGIAFVGIFGTASALLGNEKGVQTTLLATQAMITSGVWVHLLKVATSRERPMGAYMYSHDLSGEWYGLFAEFDKKRARNKSGFAFDAFPSGHTALAFSIATVFASRYNDTRIVPILSYSLASMVGVTRLIEHEHWASDVFVGGLLGYICGKQVVDHFNATHHSLFGTSLSHHPKKTQISLIENGNQIGLRIKWN